jgi:hypothetical protein
MGFRVIVTGVRHFTDYARLRDALDRLLARRLPDDVILSRCGRGTDALATSYAVERGMQVVPHPLDLERDRAGEAAAGPWSLPLGVPQAGDRLPVTVE